jgi:hypothetical protein
MFGEVKPEGFWDAILENEKKMSKFKSDMGRGLQVAKDNGKGYSIITPGKVPQSMRDWFEKMGIEIEEID